MDNNQLIMIVLMIGVFYFLVIRPQAKKSKEEAKYRSGLDKGDKVITIGGIHGKIVSLQDTTLQIECEGSGTKLKIERNAILPPSQMKEKK
ncbi:MAG: preprotein translocase subunit YajC [Flavobacteriales bacterium]